MKARIAAFLLHVTRRKEMDQGADRRDMRQHHRGQAVDVQSPLQEPAAPQRKMNCLRPAGSDLIKNDQRKRESEHLRSDPDSRDFWAESRAEQADDQTRRQRRQQYE